MKIRIEQIDKLDEPEIVIKCSHIDDAILQIQSAIFDIANKNTKISFAKDGKEYFLPLTDILFFESVDGTTYAHSASAVYKIKYKLYELEDLLPNYFARISKSSIVNIQQIYSITRYVATPNTIQFVGSHKQINVSRQYFKQLRAKLNERRTA